MRSIKSMESLKHKTITPRRIRNLANKALKDNFCCEPAAGFVYLETLESNDLFEISKGFEGVYLENNDSATKVIIIKANNVEENDRQFYLGCRNIANKTEVKILRRGNEEE